MSLSQRLRDYTTGVENTIQMDVPVLREAANLIDRLEDHLDYARKGDTRRPPHAPACVLCVAEPSVKQFPQQEGK